MIDDYSGLQKAAILLITLGPEKASAIFQHLKEDEIESLTLEIANTRSVSPQDKESVLDEYYQVCLAQQYIAEGGIGYAKELLEKALGSEKAQGVISKLTASLQVRPFEFVRKTEPAQLLNFIQDEHPQTIAMILSYLSSSQAAMILGALPPEKQADVARRIAQWNLLRPATKLCWLQPRSLPQSPIHIHCLKHCIRDLISIRQKYAYALYPTGLRQKRMAV